MILAWKSYRSDLGRVYPMFAVGYRQTGEVPSTLNLTDVLPPSITTELIAVERTCGVGQLTPRAIVIWSSDGAQYRLNYPQPFSQNIFDYLTLNSNVTAFEFVGERLRYGRLRRLLDSVRP